MGDLLLSLAARSLGRLDGVRPRLPAVFEPVQLPPSPVPHGGAVEVEAERPRPSLIQPPPARGQAEVVQPPLGRAAREPSPERAAVPPVLVAEQPTDRSRPGGGDLRDREQDPSPAPVAYGGPRVPRDRLPGPEPQPEPEAGLLARPPATPRPEAPPPVSPPAGEWSPPPSDAGPPITGDSSSASSSVFPEGARPAEALHLLAEVARPDRAWSEGRPRQDGAAAPRVTVSIGRVEVRAPASQAPAPPVSPPVAEPDPRLSLADYLERSRRRR
jgi:hypothetical protein